MFSPLILFKSHRQVTIIVSLVVLISTTTLFLSSCGLVQSNKGSSNGNQSIIRVNANCQIYDPVRPWLKRSPVMRPAIGTILSNGRILVTAEMVTNAIYIELEQPDTKIKSGAVVEFIDYESNLALLKAQEPDYLKKNKPLSLKIDTKVGDAVEVWQLEENDSLAKTSGKVNTVEVGPYPEGVGRYLVYRLNLSLQYREDAATLPVIKDGKLAGLLFRYDSRDQNAAIIAAPVIEHFLRDASDGSYQGFPRLGMGFTSLRDPELRAHTLLPDTVTGILIDKIVKNSPGNLAGLEKGDVLSAIDEFTLDSDGNYEDPLHGKISLENLISTKKYVGDRITLTIYRDGKKITKTATLARRDPDSFVSPPYSYDQEPRYLVYGGFVFLELSRGLLKTFGNNWVSNAPQKLVYLDSFQDDLFPEGQRRIIIIGQVFPSASTTSYERLAGSVLTKVNGHEIKSLADINQGLVGRKGTLDKIELADDPYQIFLDPLLISEETPQLQKAYGIKELERLK